MFSKWGDQTSCYLRCGTTTPDVSTDSLVATGLTLAQAEVRAAACKLPPPPPECTTHGPQAPPALPTPSFRDVESCAKSEGDWFLGWAKQIWDWIGTYEFGSNDDCYSNVGWIWSIIKDWKPTPVTLLIRDALQLVDIGRGLVSSLYAGDGQCDYNKADPVATLHGMLGIAQKYLGDIAKKPLRRTERWLDSICPDGIPGQGETDQLFVTSRIDEYQWECWTRANNEQPETRAGIIDMGYSRPGVSQIVDAMNRGLISDEEGQLRLKAQGVRWSNDRLLFEQLARYTPGPGDVIRFMVRDVYDESVVEDFGLDDEFTDKFAGKAVEHAKAVGVDADTLKFFWRAHWTLPSAGQAMEMFHRLRPGRYHEGVSFDEGQLRQLLQINDVAPAFIDRFIAISRPLNRLVDTRAAFNANVIGVDEAIESQQDRGLSKEDATVLVRLWSARRRDWLKSRGWYKRWVKGELFKAQVIDAAQADGVSRADIDSLEQGVTDARNARTSAICVKALHKRYLMGDLSDGETGDQLLAFGYGPGEMTDLLNGWRCELRSRGKNVGAAELCQYVEQGLIEAGEYVTRLVRLGYSPADARKTASVCQGKIAAKLNALDGRRRMAQEKAQAKRDADLAKQKGMADKARTLAQKQEELREREAQKAWLATVKASGVVAKVSGEDNVVVLEAMKAILNRVEKEHGFSASGAGDMVKELAAAIKDGKVTEWRPFVDKVLKGVKRIPDPDLIRGEPLP